MIELDEGNTLHCLHNHVETFDQNLPVAIDIVADHPLAWYPGDCLGFCPSGPPDVITGRVGPIPPNI